MKALLMLGRKLQNLALAVFCLTTALGLADAAAQIFSPDVLTPDALEAARPWKDQGCGYGSYRAPNGSCDIVKDPNANCQPGFHSVPAPRRRGSGFRCVQDGY
jgi:hypothetical protein